MNRRTESARWLLATLSAVAVIGAILNTGCYSRVVEARGLGADRIETQEPYQESGQLDRWIFGDDPAERQRNRTR